jgi:hypothetical protein
MRLWPLPAQARRAGRPDALGDRSRRVRASRKGVGGWPRAAATGSGGRWDAKEHQQSVIAALLAYPCSSPSIARPAAERKRL